MRIDAHMHFTPDAYRARLAARALLAFPLPEWSTPGALAFMDANAFDRAMLSLSPPGVAFGDQGLADELARLVNEATTSLIAMHPRRFAGLAVLPLPDVDSALVELRHALDVLELDGIVLLSNVLGRYPGDPAWGPLFDELERRETTRAIAALIAAGAPRRWPRIRYTALATDPLALATARDMAGLHHIVLGSDWPYVDALDPCVERYGGNAAALLSACS